MEPRRTIITSPFTDRDCVTCLCRERKQRELDGLTSNVQGLKADNRGLREALHARESEVRMLRAHADSLGLQPAVLPAMGRCSWASASQHGRPGDRWPGGGPQPAPAGSCSHYRCRGDCCWGARPPAGLSVPSRTVPACRGSRYWRWPGRAMAVAASRSRRP
jgi:hypothetical protein